MIIHIISFVYNLISLSNSFGSFAAFEAILPTRSARAVVIFLICDFLSSARVKGPDYVGQRKHFEILSRTFGGRGTLYGYFANRLKV